MALTEFQVKNAKPQGKNYRIKDENGLYLEVRTTGKKVWRMRYWFQSKENILTFGDHPLISLKEARIKRDEARKQLNDGVDPARLRDQKRKSFLEEKSYTERNFAKYALDWLEVKKRGQQNEKYLWTIERRLTKYILPAIGNIPFEEVTSKDLLDLSQRLIEADLLETSHRVLSICGQVFRYGIIIGACKNDPTYALKGALPSRSKEHFASIQDKTVLGNFHRSIDSYNGSPTVRTALKFLVLTFPRPTELIHLEWNEIDIEDALWRVPPEKMKMKRPHVVPLAKQTIALLEYIKPFSGTGRYVFPSPRSATGNKPMSENALVVAMRTMGYEKTEVCAHGFRHTASTMLNESQLWSPDAIERQLAHVESNKIRGTYNAAIYLDERRRMMQWWADYIDSLASENRTSSTTQPHTTL